MIRLLWLLLSHRDRRCRSAEPEILLTNELLRCGTGKSRVLAQKAARRHDIRTDSFRCNRQQVIEIEFRQNFGRGLWVSLFVSKLEKGLAGYP
jgi:hypothetical protein